MANTYLNRTPSSSGNRKTWTFSAWFKRSKIAAGQKIFCVQGDSSNLFECYFNSNDTLAFYHYSSNGGVTDSFLGTNQVFRDTSAWYHLVLAVDTTQGTASNRVKMYVNGEQITSFSSSSYFNQNYDTYINMTYEHRIGANVNDSQYFDGYMSHAALVDGQALAPTVFGSTDSTSGIWTFKNPSGVTWGTNGFHLKFESSGNLGLDSSGNSNTFTVNGNGRQALDTPSNVNATLNPLVNNAGEMMLLTNGNTSCQSNAAQGNSWKLAVSTLGMTSGKYYWEIKFDNVHNCYNNGVMGSNILTANTSNPMNQTGYTGFYNYDGGEIRKDNVVTTQDYGTYATNDIMGVACDMDNYTITFYKNGSAFVSNVALSTTGRDVVFPCSVFYNTNNTGIPQASYNFGNGYFGTTAISSAGSNGNGSLFEYDVPSGYYALNTKNINTYG